MDALGSYVSIHHAWKLTFGSAILCTSATVETAVRGVIDVHKYFTMKTDNREEVDKIRKRMSANLGSALFYGICAVNIIPGTALLGAAIFTIYSMFDLNKQYDIKNDYLLSRVVGYPSLYVFENVVCPVASKISAVTQAILQSIPSNPAWQASGMLLTAIVVVKFALPALGIVII